MNGHGDDTKRKGIRGSVVVVLAAGALAAGAVLGGAAVAWATGEAAATAKAEASFEAPELPREWRPSRPTVTFDHMYRAEGSRDAWR